MKLEKRSRYHRPKVVKEQHKVVIAQLYLKGNSQQAIANQLGISRSQVGIDLKEIYAEWQKKYIRDISDLKTKELEKLDALEAEYWEIYERSKSDTIRKITKARTDSSGKTVEVSEILSKNIGSHQVLDSIAKIVEQRCRLLGLEKININVNHSGTLTIEEKVKQMSDEELINLIQIHH